LTERGMSEKVSCVEGARWRRPRLGTGEKEKATVEMGIGFLGTRERKDWSERGKKGRKGGNVGKWERGKEMVERGEEMGIMEGREKGMGCRGGKGRKEGLECWKREWKEEIRRKVRRNENDGTLSWKGWVGKEGKGEKREKVVERS